MSTSIHFLTSLIISIYLQYIHSVYSDDQTTTTLIPSLAPTPEFPKTLSFSLSLYMEDARFNGGHGKYTLDHLFRRTLCICSLSFPESYCNKPLQKDSPDPTFSPTTEPTIDPTLDPTTDPTYDPTRHPTLPTLEPTMDPSMDPTTDPTLYPTKPTVEPTVYPTFDPTLDPTTDPTSDPTTDPTVYPTQPSVDPTSDPTSDPTQDPSTAPTASSSNPTRDPTSDPTQDPTVDPTSDPTLEPTVDPTENPTEPTMEPTIQPTSDPTTDPTLEPTLPSSAPTSQPSIDPTMEPTLEPTSTPLNNRRLLNEHGLMRKLLEETTETPLESPAQYTIYDLNVQFFVVVNDRNEESHTYQIIKGYNFFNEYKQCLLKSLDTEYVMKHYNNASIVEFKSQIQSMQVSPMSDIGILTPTHHPTPYPTYDYKAGQAYGDWMIGIGVCVLVGVFAYWMYRRYIVHQDYKKEQKSAAPQSVELQSLFDEDSFHD